MVNIVDPWHEQRKKTTEMREKLGIDSATLLVALEPVQMQELAKLIAKELKGMEDVGD